MGAGAIKKENKVAINYGIKLEKIYMMDGEYYCNLNRDECKLGVDILNSMEKFNSFSKDQDVDFNKTRVTKSATKMQ